MPDRRSKIVDEQEVLTWFEQGRTYQWMVDEYRRKYNIDTGVSMWSNFRQRRGLARRIARNEELLPWAVADEHRWSYPVMMLRIEARARDGYPLSEDSHERLASWKEKLAEADAVVHYDADTDEGFFYVRRRPGMDTDLIRVPEPGARGRGRRD